MTLPKTIITLATASAALALTPAMAATEFSPVKRSQEISIISYDLTKSEHAEIILKKIETAAKRVCGYSTVRQSVRERFLQEVCAETAVQEAVASTNAPTLNAALEKSKQ